MRYLIGILCGTILIGGLTYFCIRDLGFRGFLLVVGAVAVTVGLAYGLVWGLMG